MTLQCHRVVGSAACTRGGRVCATRAGVAAWFQLAQPPPDRKLHHQASDCHLISSWGPWLRLPRALVHRRPKTHLQASALIQFSRGRLRGYQLLRGAPTSSRFRASLDRRVSPEGPAAWWGRSIAEPMEASAPRGVGGHPVAVAQGSPAHAAPPQPPIKYSEVCEWDGTPVERLPAASTLV